MSAPPLIGVSGRRWPAHRLAEHIPPAMCSAEFDLHYSEYPTAIVAAGGLPVELCRDAPVTELIARLDGLVLTGGADLDPAAYGEPPAPELGAVEPDRDRWEQELLAAALAVSLPVLAICRGLQLVNVHHGGSLVQHLPTDPVDHARFSADRSGVAHRIETESGSLAQQLYSSSADVNSLHHQAIDRLGDGLIVTARAPDGVIEAVETPGGSVLGVQWHPEMLAQPDAAFRWLVEAASRS